MNFPVLLVFFFTLLRLLALVLEPRLTHLRSFSADPQICLYADFMRPCNFDTCGRSVASFYFACDINGHDAVVYELQSAFERQRRRLGAVLSIFVNLCPDHRASRKSF